ncbi:aminotransferase class V-fold PLP-dependent enzyme [Salisaeta longa]|uniref:aminotransferase class V-fold PLP-dependent enzyme n=1 Tax=Salisaeta longa TaxID=503170 RepID=UPI0003B3D68A|nr:aminotransferase class V-fold PLP-dependent enzyme [Salisaeta longa]
MFSTVPAATTHRPRAERLQLLEALRTSFDGLDTTYERADGTRQRRIYLDSAASNLRCTAARAMADRAMQHYANTHSQLHMGASLMTALYDEAHAIVRRFVGAPEAYTAIFCGTGVTGGLNRMARVLTAQRPSRDVVITTMMEHHANDLPHRKHAGRVVHVPLAHDPDGEAGRVDMDALRRAIRTHADRLNYVAVTAASNVTGITNPVHEIARLAHDVGALCVVDAAQSAAHSPIRITGDRDDEALDVVCLSGHKIYAPGSPGVIVARKDLFAGHEPEEVGGGIVEFVDTERYTVTDALPDREETGTPNLPGAFLLASMLLLMERVGMDLIAEDERALTQYAMERFTAIDGLHLYGSHRLEVAERIGVLTFNLEGLPHGLVTAILNDYFGIAVRNECFCAQPFVRQLLGIADATGVAPDSCLDTCTPQAQPGMVRVSLGLYNTRADVDAAADALADIAARPDAYRSKYRALRNGHGDWAHTDFNVPPHELLTLEGAADDWVRDALSS